MNIRSILMATTMVGGVVLAVAPAQAGPYAGAVGASGVCPNVLGADGPQGAGSGSAADCNLTITFKANGAITTSGPGGDYESADDSLIGIVNNSGHTITSFVLSNAGVDIFGFDGDGIDTYVNNTAANGGLGYATKDWYPVQSSDTSGYGGPLVYYTGVNGAETSGTINIFGGLASGSSTFFSLEEGVNLTAPPVVTPTPEPASLALLGVALAGVGAIRRRRKAAV